jgi:flavin reductase (DIM6/NTAB) family NADH-FMN oxidoreductase RutF
MTSSWCRRLGEEVEDTDANPLFATEESDMTDQIFDAREFRNALGRFATGVTVITTVKDGKTHGMTTNAFVPVSLDPPLVLISLNNRSHMHQILPATGRYGISVLAEDQCALSNHFAGQTIDDLHIRFINHAGTVLLDGAIAHFVAKVVDVHSGGDHTLYVGSVEYFASRDEKPLLFYGGRYQRLPS